MEDKDRKEGMIQLLMIEYMNTLFCYRNAKYMHFMFFARRECTWSTIKTWKLGLIFVHCVYICGPNIHTIAYNSIQYLTCNFNENENNIRIIMAISLF